jgi:hypothetical protein
MGKKMLHLLGQPVQKALPGPDGIAQDDAPEHLSTFHHNTFFTPLFTIKNAYKTSFFDTKQSYVSNPAALMLLLLIHVL